MGQNLWCHIWVNEHPFTIYFDVHQGYKVLTQSHIYIYDYIYMYIYIYTRNYVMDYDIYVYTCVCVIKVIYGIQGNYKDFAMIYN